MRRVLSILIAKAKLLGLPDKDITYASDYLTYNEPGLAFDHITTQLYEYDIKIDRECFELITQAGASLGISKTEFDHLKVLINL